VPRADDVSWGAATAPVTIVIFSDFQCPFCARGAATIAELEKKHGPDNLRVVWKNLPLPFHDRAKPAAEAALAVRERLGDTGFWAFHDKLFANQRELGTESLVRFAAEVGFTDAEALRADLTGHRFAARVDADLRLASELGVHGTPAFFVNGVLVSGAQPLAAFDALVNRERAKADVALAQGTPRASLYATMVAVNYVAPKPEAAEEDDDPVDTTVYAVPVGRSPVRGAADALVTIVAFGDFQCPYCKRGAATVEQVQKRFGSSVRVVWKHEPLPFHPQAEPAAELAEEARAQKGSEGFWAAHDALFALDRVNAESLAGLETKLGLRHGSVDAAIKGHAHAKAIDADEELAEALEANGTPHFFVNGRRLVGAQPEAAFAKLVEEELAKAKARVAKGTKASEVYAAIVREGKPGKELERKVVPAPVGSEPFRGGPQAKVVITQFSDFQCPFCQRVEPTINTLLEQYGDRVKLVWRNLPLPMHPDAPIAAEAALEAQRQKGNSGFWAMHAKLFATRDFSMESLHAMAKDIGLDVNAFDAALRDHRHEAAVKRDGAIAEAAGIRGTPAFVINGRFLAGAQPLKKFRRAVERALDEAK
jgi:protein-disulfide isomerase